MRLSSSTRELFKALAQKNYGKLVKKQVQGKDGKMHTVWVDPNKDKKVKEKSKEEQIKERKSIKKKVENKQPKHSEEDIKKIKEITERHTQFEKEAREQRRGYGSGPMVPKVGAIMRVYAKGKANVGGMLGKIKEIAHDGKSVIVQLTSGNFYSFGLQDLQFAKSSIYNIIQISKAKKREEGETWTQPSGRKVTKKNGKIIPVKDEQKKEILPQKSKTAPLDEIPLDKIATLLPAQMKEAKAIYEKVKNLPESELRARLERLKKVPGKSKISGVKAIEHALEKFNIPEVVKEQKQKVAEKIKQVVKRTRNKKETIETPIIEPVKEPEVSRGTNVKSNEVLESSIVDNSEQENNFDTMPDSKNLDDQIKKLEKELESFNEPLLKLANTKIPNTNIPVDEYYEQLRIFQTKRQELDKLKDKRRDINKNTPEAIKEREDFLKQLQREEEKKIRENSITSTTYERAKKRLDKQSEGWLTGKKNGEEKIFTPQTITASNLTIALDQLLKLGLDPKDRTYLERVKAVRDRLPAKQIEQIQNSIKSMDVKDKDFVISTIRNYITDSILKYGETAPPSVDKPAKTTKVQNKVIATKLKNLANGLDKQIDSLKNSAIGQQRPTRRRSGIAYNMYERGERLEAIQAGLNGLSDLWSKNEVPPELQSIRSKSDMEFIYNSYNSLKKYPKDNFDPTPYIRTWRMKDLSGFLNGVDSSGKKLTEDYKKDYGGKLYDVKPEYLLKNGLIDKEFIKDAREVENIINGNDLFKTTDQALMKKIERVLATLEMIETRKIQINSSTGKPYYTQKSVISDKFENKQYAALGINTKDELMQAGEALEKIISGKYTPETPKEKQIKEKERNLLGNKIPGFFPTPRPIIDEAIEKLDVQPGMKVLEPSAGKGDMADALKEQGADVDVIEPYSSLRDILELKEHNIISDDIMDITYTYGDRFVAPDGTEGIMRGSGGLGSNRVQLKDDNGNFLGYYNVQDLKPLPKYDRILMNPPFEKGQDIDHTKKAYELLKPGGRMVSIVSEGPFFRSSNKDREFREWLDALGADVEKLPEGSFKNAFVSTGVATRMIVIDKPYQSSSPIDHNPTKLIP